MPRLGPALTALALLASLVVACAAETPATPNVPAGRIATVIQWFEERTMRCAGPNDVGGNAEFQCHLDMSDTTDEAVYDVLIATRDGAIVEIGASVNLEAEPVDVNPTIGFLADSVGGSPASGALGPAITQWVEQNLRTGGRTTIGGIDVILSPLAQHTQIELIFPATEP